MRKLTCAFCAILFTAVLVMATARQDSGKPEQKSKMQSGKVVSVDAAKKELVISADGGMETRLLITPSTKITREGKSISLAEVKAGDTVTTDCEDSGDGCKAKSVQVTEGKTSQ
jgi:hypothetical protein